MLSYSDDYDGNNKPQNMFWGIFLNCIHIYVFALYRSQFSIDFLKIRYKHFFLQLLSQFCWLK